VLPLGRIASQLRELRWTQVFVELHDRWNDASRVT
jgi:hypothetical protein